MKYELCYLVGESNEPNLEKIDKEVKAIIAECGGKFEEPQIIEKRKMAYSIKKEIRGLYITQRFEAENGEAIPQATKKLNLNQNILRFLFVKADGLPKMEVYKKYSTEPEKPEKKNKEAGKNKPAKKESKQTKAKEAKPEEKPANKKEIIKEKKQEKKTAEDKKENKKDFKENKKDKKIKNEKRAIPSDDEIDKTLEEILNI